jgi:pimeloyl-ACP methyl ester carboxylesterase
VSGRTGAETPPRARATTVAANGVSLHCVERGAGAAVVFVHMGGRDHRYWEGQLAPFARRGYRAVAYSRRFAHPNANPMVPDYSPRTDAADLAALIDAAGLAPAHVVASSIGACAALFLAADRPELVRSLVLAEPPMLGWARDAPGGSALVEAFFDEVWRPAGDAFRRRDAEGGMRVLMDYFVGPGAFDGFPARLRARVLENARDWAAHATSRDPFPTLDRGAVRALTTPTLMLGGGRTLPLHRIVDAELERLLGRGRRVVVPDASHDVWGDAPTQCRAETLAFLAVQDVVPSPRRRRGDG